MKNSFKLILVFLLLFCRGIPVTSSVDSVSAATMSMPNIVSSGEDSNNKVVKKHRYAFGVSPFFKSGFKFFITPTFSYRIRKRKDLDLNLGFEFNRNRFEDTPSSESFDSYRFTCGLSRYPTHKWYYGGDIHLYYMNPNDEFVNYVTNYGNQLEDQWIPAFSVKTGYSLTQVKLSKKWQFPLILELSYIFGKDYNYLRPIPGTKDHYEIQGFDWTIKTSFRF